MYRTDGSLVLSPTDLTRHQACPHATTLDLAVADGRLRPPLEGPTDHAALAADLGTEHELRYLAAPAARAGRRRPPLECPTDHAALVADLGTEHELRYLDALEAEGRSSVRIPARFDAAGRHEAEAMTLQALRAAVHGA